MSTFTQIQNVNNLQLKNLYLTHNVCSLWISYSFVLHFISLKNNRGASVWDNVVLPTEAQQTGSLFLPEETNDLCPHFTH